MIYLELFFIALVVVFVIDLSGFTDSWRSALARLLKVRELKPLRPFDCSLCATWWACLVYAAVIGKISLPVVAYIAGLSYFTMPMRQLLTLAWELLLRVIGALYERLNKIR